MRPYGVRMLNRPYGYDLADVQEVIAPSRFGVCTPGGDRHAPSYRSAQKRRRLRRAWKKKARALAKARIRRGEDR